MITALENITIVLVETSHPGNIGAAARAMKTMGVGSLRLVKPKVFPSADATARAAGADDILARATQHESLADALADSVMVYGTSARLRTLSCPVLGPDEAVREMLELTGSGKRIAVVFGRESAGLSNEELEYCNRVMVIPTADGFSSLNLAAAVQIICYELMKQSGLSQAPETGGRAEPVSAAEMDRLYQHLQECLVDIGFMDAAKPRKLMRRLKNLFNRAGLDSNEYNILRGILTAAQEQVRKE